MRVTVHKGIRVTDTRPGQWLASHRDRLGNINDVFAKLRAGQVDGRIVLTEMQ
ncbi:hypothetical protein [Burkholderia sp. Ac-20353]|uniref:hypothetical protein n=1 Tax=Burkholderia sp. Ac-20353 TaxID=2703894 RepID=UPI00197BA049|nr:hypothetical protein [Burkholderia sp. Ac-20353]MBN3789973.1 hypothetical protein [Burkholderia sp. Ac-20353]